MVDYTSILVSTDGNKWHGGVLGPDGKIYAAPYGANFILVLDPEMETTDTASFPVMTDGAKWQDTVVSGNSLYMIPFFSTSILKLSILC
eukprot:m.120540 g.120540  ORF g.120540 m.120540 type:complete len:89 (-) comp9372_c0_seq2:212-478(-)